MKYIFNAAITISADSLDEAEEVLRGCIGPSDHNLDLGLVDADFEFAESVEDEE